MPQWHSLFVLSSNLQGHLGLHTPRGRKIAESPAREVSRYNFRNV